MIEAVDLGLSVKWASCNVGASSPEEYGDYYGWGETEVKDDSLYSWVDNEHYLGDLNNDGDIDADEMAYLGSNICKTSYDVAHVKWGGNWRMPTRGEVQELQDRCTWEWITINGVSGRKVTGPNGNSIFFPAAGFKCGIGHEDINVLGWYWTGTSESYHTISSYALAFEYKIKGWNSGWYGRSYGIPVRPVTE